MRGKKKNGHKTTTPTFNMDHDSLQSRLGPDGNLLLEDIVETSVVTAFFVQKLGQATSEEINQKVSSINATINSFKLEQTLRALQARGLISYARGRSPNGESVIMWKPKQAIWAAPPEVMLIKKGSQFGKGRGRMKKALPSCTRLYGCGTNGRWVSASAITGRYDAGCGSDLYETATP